MGTIRLLDCTLRDGGYVNDWEFGHNNLISIYERLADAGVDIIEVGFLDDRRPYDINRSIMPDTESANFIWKNAKKRPPMVVGMIDYGTCSIENIQPCSESFLDGIRVIFKKHIMHEAMEFCAELKKLGYIVFSQLVSVTAYTDDELVELAGLVNDVKPYAVSMVDTYGLLNPDKLLHIYKVLDDNVDKSIQIGFHAHNNFQLAFANAIAFCKKETARDVVVDGTLYGMGKSAGNAPMELLAMYLNEYYDTNYNIAPMLECIEESIMDFYAINPWGYKTFFYLCAKNMCHPSYVSYYQKKENLSITKLDSLLGKIEPFDKKLLYDKDVAEDLYKTFMSMEGDDSKAIGELASELKNHKVLLIGPGKNIQLQEKSVRSYIEKENPKIISINYIPGAYKVDYVFTTKRKRYQQMTDSLHEIKNKDVVIIATSNVDCIAGTNCKVINRAPLLEQSERIKDNSLLMLLQVLKRAGIYELACAGFDGYSEKEDNYFNPNMEYSFVKDEADHLNYHMKDALRNQYADMKIDFITYSHYTEVEDSHDAAF